MANVWRERALEHYDQVSWLVVRVLELEGIPRGDDRFQRRFVEILRECEDAVAKDAASAGRKAVA